MTLDRTVMAFAGLVILVSLALAQLDSPYRFLLTAFVGLNLIQASFTGFCPAAMIFKRLGARPGTSAEAQGHALANLRKRNCAGRNLRKPAQFLSVAVYRPALIEAISQQISAQFFRRIGSWVMRRS
jgi:hypothetical protein